MAKNPQNQENTRAAHRLKRRAEALRANLRRRKEAGQSDPAGPESPAESSESDQKPAPPEFTTSQLKS
jgi:hypothetical protein